MILVGRSKDISDIIPEEIVESVKAAVNTLDTFYGPDRDIFANLGGFVCILQSKEDFQSLKNDHCLSITEDVFESEILVNGYIQRMYSLSSDYVIQVYCRKELIS